MCCVTDKWFTPHFSLLARFRIDAWMADVSCPIACQPIWPACWLDTPDRSSSSSSRVVQDVWGVFRDVLEVVEPHLSDAEFRKAWMPYFCRSGHPEVSSDRFLDFIGHFLPQHDFLDLPQITGRDLQDVARAKKATAGGLDGWAWNEIKALPLPWFSGLAILLSLVESTGTWPQGLLDAYI